MLNRDPHFYLDEVHAKKEITTALKQSYLALFIGSGVSSATSPNILPSWSELVERCCKAATPKIKFEELKATDNEYLLERANRIEDQLGGKYLEIVKKCLYGEIKYSKKLLNRDLMISIGSIVMSLSRRSTGVVVNYNFDDLLEWYLYYHGYDPLIVTKSDQVISASDVVIYHPHGFLPYLDSLKSYQSDKIVFSKRSYVDAKENKSSYENEMQRAVLRSKLVVCIGMSGDDDHFEHLCTVTYENQLKRKRMIGFIVLTKSEINTMKTQKLLDMGLAPLAIESHNKLPDMLLELCRNGAEKKII